MRGRTDLSNSEYDEYLAKNKRHRELQERHIERKNANKGYEGWHFGIGNTPVKCKDKEEFKRALSTRGLVMRDEVKKDLK